MNSFTALYQEKQSKPEQWDPRAKIVGGVLVGGALLATHHLVWLTVLMVLLVALWRVAKLSWRLLVVTLVALGAWFVSTMIFNVYFLHPDDLARGLEAGAVRNVRLAAFVMLLAFVVRTTPPMQLAEALERLLAPLQRVKVPVHELTMLFAIALRFLPLLAAEVVTLRNAQLARGAGLHRGSLLRRLRALMPLLLPVFVRTFVRAEELAAALEVRGYRGAEGRTSCYAWHWTRTETLLTLSALALLLASWFVFDT